MNFFPIEQSHLAECADLFVSVFNQAPWNENWKVETVLHRLEACFQTPRFFGLLAKSENEALAFVLGNAEHWDKSELFYLKEMCVAAQHQRSGLGTYLLQDLETELKIQGIEKLVLHTARETPAQAFYEKQGFYVSSKMIMMAKWLHSP